MLAHPEMSRTSDVPLFGQATMFVAYASFIIALLGGVAWCSP